MKENILLVDYSTKRVREKKEIRECGKITANTSRNTCIRPTPDELGKELIREMQNEMINWGVHR